MPRKFTKAAVLSVWRELDEAIREEDRAGTTSDGSGVFYAAHSAWLSLAGVLGVEAKHDEATQEGDE